jgi:hypothetical protein
VILKIEEKNGKMYLLFDNKDSIVCFVIMLESKLGDLLNKIEHDINFEEFMLVFGIKDFKQYIEPLI